MDVYTLYDGERVGLWMCTRCMMRRESGCGCVHVVSLMGRESGCGCVHVVSLMGRESGCGCVHAV